MNPALPNLIEFTPEILQKLKSEGYKYILHAYPSAQEEQELECCERSLVKYIPIKTIADAEDYEATLGDATYTLDMHSAENELEEVTKGKTLIKIYVNREYGLAS